MSLSFPEKRLARLPPSSFSPHLFPTSDSVRNFPVTSGSVTAERFGCRCRFCLRLCRSLRFAFRHRLCLALVVGSFTVSDFESLPSSSKSSMLFSPAVGYALVLPAVGYALVLPAVGYTLSVLCCWACSSRGHRTRVASSFFSPLTLGLWFRLCFLSPLALWLWFCLCSLSSGVASSSTTLWEFTAPKFASCTSNVSTQLAPLRDHWFAVGARAPHHCSAQQRRLLFVRSGLTPSGLGDFVAAAVRRWSPTRLRGTLG